MVLDSQGRLDFSHRVTVPPVKYPESPVLETRRVIPPIKAEQSRFPSVTLSPSVFRFCDQKGTLSEDR